MDDSQTEPQAAPPATDAATCKEAADALAQAMAALQCVTERVRAQTARWEHERAVEAAYRAIATRSNTRG